MTSRDFSQEAHYLDSIQALLAGGEVERGLTDLVTHLYHLNRELEKESFDSFVQSLALKHPIRDLIHQDPYAHRSFTKPRGYPGDPELIDFYFGYNGPNEDATVLGREIFRYSMARPASESVRSRAALLGNLIDEVARKNPRAKILSIACGHLREAAWSDAVQSGAIGSLIGLDEDAESIEFIKKTKGNLPIEPYLCTIRSIVHRDHCFENLDLVYTAGLLDYFQVPFAARLTTIMFEMLNPGGRLLVGNFAPETEERGYMETFMAWRLDYKDESQVSALAAEIDDEEIEAKRIFRDPYRNVIYLELSKK